jgi:hypothetical protein
VENDEVYFNPKKRARHDAYECELDGEPSGLKMAASLNRLVRGRQPRALVVLKKQDQGGRKNYE